MSKDIELSQEDFGLLAICAIRYCHGRMSYMPDLIRGIVRPNLKEVSDKDLNIMLEDSDFQRRMGLYGDEDIDKPGWIQWEQTIREEIERRRSSEC